MVCAAFTALAGWPMPTAEQWLFIGLAGLFGVLGQLLMTYSYRYAEASTVAPLDYANLLLAVFYGYYFFGELPHLSTWIGAPLVIAAGAIILWREYRLAVPRPALAGVAERLRSSPALFALDDVAERAEQRAFVSAPARGRQVRHDPAREPRERQALEPHVAGPAQPREEHAFAAEDHRLHAADADDVVVDGLRQRDEAARVDVQLFAGFELALDERAARVHEHEAVAFELLHDEAFAAEQAGEHALLKRDADRHAFRGGEERVLLADQLAADASRDRARGSCRGRAPRTRRAPCRCLCA